MILLQAQSVGRSFDGIDLFTNVNLQIQDNSRIGLVGPNGIGKTTLLEILAGITEPDYGAVTSRKNLSVGYLAQNSGLDSGKEIYAEMLDGFATLRTMERQLHTLEKQIADPTTADDPEVYAATLKQYDQLSNDFREQNGYGYEAEIRNVLSGFNFAPERYHDQISTLSGGERSRLALAKMLLSRHDLIILDEPTNHLDIDTLGWLEGYLRGYNGAILIVSHDQYFLDHTINEVYELAPRGATHYTGNYTQYRQQRAANLDQAWKAYNKQQEEIAKLQEFVDKNIVRASSTKQAQSRRKQLEKMDRLERPTGEQSAHFHFTADKSSGNEVLKVQNATIGYAPDEPMAGPIDFTVNKGERIGIVGPNGVGKSTLLKSVLGRIPFLKGDAVLGANVQPGYYDQDQASLNPKNTVLEEVWQEHPTTPEKDIRSALAAFLLGAGDVDKTVASLSGGQRARLLMTKLAMDHDNFLILDEPTNHLDINSKEVLEQALENFDGTVLFVSHDRYFINDLADRLVVLSPAGSETVLGNWDYYQEKQSEDEPTDAADHLGVFGTSTTQKQTTNSQGAADYAAAKADQKVQRKLQRRVDAAEQAIEELEAQKQSILDAMALPENATAAIKLQDMQKDVDALDAQLADAEAEWEAAGMALEENQ